MQLRAVVNLKTWKLLQVLCWRQNLQTAACSSRPDTRLVLLNKREGRDTSDISLTDSVHRKHSESPRCCYLAEIKTARLKLKLNHKITEETLHTIFMNPNGTSTSSNSSTRKLMGINQGSRTPAVSRRKQE